MSDKLSNIPLILAVSATIAIVRMETMDTVLVHCIPDHYKVKNVGDPIHFKKYQGKQFHIQCFAHNEEED
ncbi:MAG TPA: hypothetical protein PLR06_10000 [Cyclobacteriaceae bacterium]|nr:hypothetical protein [Cyclobacteriaceae bacterium]